MGTSEREFSVPPEKVWTILADGWLYPLWVVGASRIREVDQSWPAPASRLHHSFGIWPAVVDDETEVLECVPHERLTLRARGWPLGEAHVEIHLQERGAGTLVTIVEQAVKGPGALLPNVIEDAVLAVRNKETLRRLAYLAERR